MLHARASPALAIYVPTIEPRAKLVQGGPLPRLLVACTLGLTQQEAGALNGQALASQTR